MVSKLIKLMMGAVIMVAVVGSLVSCKQPNDTKWQYLPDMADSPVPKAQSAPLDPPDHSIARDAVFYLDNEIDAEDEHINPYSWAFSSPQYAGHVHDILVRGQELYETFCQHCHGAQAQGDGSITDVYPRPPDLTLKGYWERKDGFFFHKITFGGNLMPSLGHAVSPDERFLIILYLRRLMAERIMNDQNKASGAVGASASGGDNKQGVNGSTDQDIMGGAEDATTDEAGVLTEEQEGAEKSDILPSDSGSEVPENTPQIDFGADAMKVLPHAPSDEIPRGEAPGGDDIPSRNIPQAVDEADSASAAGPSGDQTGKEGIQQHIPAASKSSPADLPGDSAVQEDASEFSETSEEPPPSSDGITTADQIESGEE